MLANKYLHTYPLLTIGIILILTGLGCNPPYKLSSGEPVVLAQGGTQNLGFQTLLTKINGFVSVVRPHIKTETSHMDGTILLHNKLEEAGIKTAFVVVNTLDDKPFVTFIASETTDKGLCYFTLVPQTLDIEPSEIVQSVFLERGKKIGIIAAKSNQQNTYSWYEDYLVKFYQQRDWMEYISKYRDVVDSNKPKLDSIYNTNEQIKTLIEARIYSVPKQQIDSFNSRINRYNYYLMEYKYQANDLNNEIYRHYETEIFPTCLYYITEIRSDPNRFTPVIPKVTVNSPVPTPIPAYSYKDIESLLRTDDSYSLIPAPTKDSIKVERVSDRNFVVNTIKLWW